MVEPRRIVWAGLLACLTAFPAAAQEEPDDTLRITITPTRRPVPLAERPESTTVIGRADIEARPSADVVELLRQVPGLSIDQPGGPGGVSSVYLRGTDPNHALVLIDGIRTNDPTNTRGGSFDFSTLDPLTIERIEVVRGPLSSVYGSDAIGGVINVITREGRAFQQNALAGGIGTEGYKRGGAQTSGPITESLRFALTAGILDHGHAVEGSGLINRTVTAKVHSAPRSDTRLTLVGRFADTDAKSFPDDSGGPRFAVRRESDHRAIQEATLGGSIDHPLTDWWRLDVGAGFSWRTEDTDSPGVAPGIRDPFGIPPNTTDNRYRRLTFTAANRFEPIKGVRLALGGGIERESGTSTGVLEPAPGFALPTRFELDRNIGNVFGEVEYTLGTLVVSAGTRMDLPQGFDTAVSPRIGALYRLDGTGTTFKANWGKGFRLPSFFSLGNPIVGNPDLRPEKSTGWDVGVVQDFAEGRASVGITYFWNRVKSLIDFEEGPPPRLVNRSAATSRGIELTANWQVTPTFLARGQVTYTRTAVDDSDEPLRNRPKWRGGGEVRWRPLEEWEFGASVVRVGSVPDSSIPTGDLRLAPYTTVGATATWSPHPNLQLQLAIENLLDADYEEAVGFPAPGRQVRAAVRVTF
ncbi:MAG TPA: TonB-dependent receptor [Azospirillum sp.]|nr:TonB-dependent receptor [Azospirillum sp.]